MNRRTNSYNPPELSLDELRAYQAGQLSGPARNRIERLMLDNPFYADALDGLETLQQVGSSLQTHTYELHEALQERVHESATTRRLMPLWVTSLVASVLLVISVAIYLIFRPTAPQQAGQVVAQPIEPGTILLDPADLGPAANVPATNNLGPGTPGTFSLPKSAQAAVAMPVPSSVKAAAMAHKRGSALPHKKHRQRSGLMVEELPAAVTNCSPAFPFDEDIVTPSADPEVANRQRVNTERAFLR